MQKLRSYSMKAIIILVVMAAVRSSSVKNSGRIRNLGFGKNNNGQNENVTIIDKKIKLKIANNQVFLVPVRQLMPKIYNKKQPFIASLTPVTNKRSHRSSSSTCSIIHSPNYKGYNQIHKQKHKIRNNTEWQWIANKKSVIYKLEDIDKLQYALDMQVINNTLVVIFEDGEVIFFRMVQDKLSEVNRTFIFKNKTQSDEGIQGGGKINCMGNNFGVFVSQKYAILINVNSYNAKILEDYQQNSNLYTSIVVDYAGKKNLFIAYGKNGIIHYVVDCLQQKIQKKGSFQVFITEDVNQRVSVVDFVSINSIIQNQVNTITLLILNPRYGILKLNIKLNQVHGYIKAQRTQMQRKNCRMMSLHFQQVYVSCPQVITYNPKNNTVRNNVLLSSLPIQLLSNQQDLTVISHNSFQTLERCSGRVNQGWIDDKTFHHTVIFQDYYVSIDDLSIVVWDINYPEEFIACKGDQALEGNNSFNISVTTLCQNIKNFDGNRQCCKDIYQVQLQMFDSEKGLHLFQIYGTILLVVAALISSIIIYVKKKKVQAQYLQLHEQSELSVVDELKVPKIFSTEQAIQGKKQLELKTFQNN